MPETYINLFSDTATRPTPEMRHAIANAEVGDEQRNEDPTVNALLQRVAELLNKDQAIFLPSGTMCNQIAIRLHCRPGEEIVMEETAHARNFEAGAAAAISGANVAVVRGHRGIFDAPALREAIRPEGTHFPTSRLVVVEQTSNLGGGAVWPLEALDELSDEARTHGLATHMDGARLLNACVETGIEASRYARDFDTAWIDFSKGLGAPVGAALAGPRELMDAAWKLKHQFGGAMRQSGIIAAAALYALDNHVERLAEDNRNAREFAAVIRELDGVTVSEVETNIVLIDLDGCGVSAGTFARELEERGVLLSEMPGNRLRAVTHLDVPATEVRQAAERFCEVYQELVTPERAG
jgi:threonine aldolase